ncbi:TonB-dependent siderophore receptor [Hyphococcus sp. DH-69]|uniref:TonB-dependent siderophore receptor n=1 Tax=Hyphococcus formosus TaxID=3143534 RepID=UPI00398AC3C6
MTGFGGQASAMQPTDVTVEEEAADDLTSGSDEIVVVGKKRFFRPTDGSSATKFDLPIQDTPQSITVITDDLINTTQPDDILKIDKYVAGVYNSNDGTGHFANLGGSSLVARGFRISGDNGSKINGFSTLSVFRPDFSSIERVEVVKGPTAIIYGVNNYGGTINTVTKKPLSEFRHALSATYGSYDFKRVEIDSGGPLTTNGDLKYRLTGAWQDRGFIQDGADSEKIAVMPAIEWEISPSTSANVIMFYQNEVLIPNRSYTLIQNSEGDIVLPYELDRNVFLGLPDYNRDEIDHLQFLGGFTHEFASGLKLEAQAGYSNTESDAQAVYTYNYFPATLYTGVYNRSHDKAIETYDAELRFGGDFELFGRNHKFLINSEYRKIQRDDPRHAYVYLGAVDQFNPDFSFIDTSDPGFESPLAGFTKEERENFAIGGQLLLSLTDRLSVLVGGRGTRSQIVYRDVRDLVGTIDPEFGTFDVSADFTVTKFTPRVGLVYEFSDEVNGYLSYTEGFIPQTGTTRDGGVIDPETGQQFEGGFKFEFFEGALGVNTAAYYIERKGVGAPDPLNGPGDDFKVGGREQRNYGFEFEALGEIFEGVNIVATYSYQNAKITHDIEYPDIVGNEVAHVPRHLGSAFVQYQFLEGVLQGLSANIGFNYYGSYYHRSDNAFRFLVPDRHTFDAGVAYEITENVNLNVTVTNFTDELNIFTSTGVRYSEFVFEDPRTVKARLQVAF